MTECGFYQGFFLREREEIIPIRSSSFADAQAMWAIESGRDWRVLPAPDVSIALAVDHRGNDPEASETCR